MCFVLGGGASGYLAVNSRPISRRIVPMETLLTLVWIAVAFGVWYVWTQRLKGTRPRPGVKPSNDRGRSSTARGRGGVADGMRRAQQRGRERLRAIEGPRTARPTRATPGLRAVDDPVTALATLALVLTGDDQTPTRDVERTLRDRLSHLTDEVHVARAVRTASKIAPKAENPHGVIKELTPLFERTLTPRERADVVAICEDVVSANGIISDHQSVWLRSLRRSLGFEVKG